MIYLASAASGTRLREMPPASFVLFQLLVALLIFALSIFVFAQQTLAEGFAETLQTQGPPEAIVEHESSRVVVWEYEKESFRFYEGKSLQESAPEKVEEAEFQQAASPTPKPKAAAPSKGKAKAVSAEALFGGLENSKGAASKSDAKTVTMPRAQNLPSFAKKLRSQKFKPKSLPDAKLADADEFRRKIEELRETAGIIDPDMIKPR